MPEISLNEDQHERLEQVRQDLENSYVEDYGYIPIEDAIQYLLDTYTPPKKRDAVDDYERLATAEYPQLQAVASDVPEVPGSGIDADEMRGRLLSELGVGAFAAALDSVADTAAGGDSGSGDEPGTDPASAAAPDHSSDTGGESPPEGPSVRSGTSGDRSSASDGASAGAAGGESSGSISTDSPGGSDPLAAVNQMLSEYDDKWREGGGDEPYEVDLPDGRTESARTKDDVRQLLFRHY